MSERRGQLDLDGDAPTEGGESSTLDQLHSDPNERLTDDAAADALLREVARIEDAVLPAHDLERPGALLGPYRIVRRLGRGAMGIVYEAEDPQLSRGVALKVLAPSRVSDDERRRRFRREARAAAAVVHPNVAAVYCVGHERGLDYLAMEYVAGVTLREAMQRRGGRSRSRTRRGSARLSRGVWGEPTSSGSCIAISNPRT